MFYYIDRKQYSRVARVFNQTKNVSDFIYISILTDGVMGTLLLLD